MYKIHKKYFENTKNKQKAVIENLKCISYEWEVNCLNISQGHAHRQCEPITVLSCNK